MPPAHGGGAVIDFERDYYVAGDRAVGRTSFSPDLKGYGSPEDGP